MSPLPQSLRAELHSESRPGGASKREAASKRNKRLDVLRCVAVLLVVVHHSGAVPIVTKMGWVGVDLFFVLSGFLISGLFYAEYGKTGSINLKRFFIRRGFKIYPPFYAMLFVTFLAQLWLHDLRAPAAYLREIFFVQNYAFGIWLHTWSLAIEEHFYIFLPIFLVLALRFSADRENPFSIVPWACGAVAVLCLLFRYYAIISTPAAAFRPQFVTNPTHDRIDALFFGVLLGYLHHFRRESLEHFFGPIRNRVIAVCVTAFFLCWPFILTRDSHFFLIFGLSFLYLGFGVLLLLSLYIRNILPPSLQAPFDKLGTACAFIGVYSYSIYLWHVPLGSYGPGVVRRITHIRMGRLETYAFDVLGGILLGILMARVIEFPALHLRDRIFPTREKRDAEPQPYPLLAQEGTQPQ